MLTFIDLNGAGRTLDFPQGKKPLGLEKEGERECGSGRKMGGGEKVTFLINKFLKVIK